MGQSLRDDSGKSDYQRLRPYLVMQYFLKNADESLLLYRGEYQGLQFLPLCTK